MAPNLLWKGIFQISLLNNSSYNQDLRLITPQPGSSYRSAADHCDKNTDTQMVQNVLKPIRCLTNRNEDIMSAMFTNAHQLLYLSVIKQIDPVGKLERLTVEKEELSLSYPFCKSGFSYTSFILSKIHRTPYNHFQQLSVWTTFHRDLQGKKFYISLGIFDSRTERPEWGIIKQASSRCFCLLGRKETISSWFKTLDTRSDSTTSLMTGKEKYGKYKTQFFLSKSSLRMWKYLMPGGWGRSTTRLPSTHNGRLILTPANPQYKSSLLFFLTELSALHTLGKVPQAPGRSMY